MTAEKEPAIHSIGAPKTAFHFKGPHQIDGFLKHVQYVGKVVWMNRHLPAPIKRLFCGETSIVQQALIEELNRAIRTTGPCQGRNGVDDQPNIHSSLRLLVSMPR